MQYWGRLKMSKFIDEKGKRYGKLIVLEYNKENLKWLCQCDCGNKIYARGSELRRGAYTSCGCNHGGNKIRENITGKKFGKLTVLKYIDNRKGWKCQCECGNITYANITALKSGKRYSCGCTKDKKYLLVKKDKRFKRLYSIYKSMKNRCYKKYSDSYEYYGAKGIKICDEWLGEEGFLNFFDWSIKNGYIEIEGTYGDKLSIDRIDSNKDYSPKNCRWITMEENIARSGAGTYKLETKVQELNTQSEDELVQNYIQRKIELQEQKILKEERKTSKGNFFYRKPNYCILHNFDNTKQFLFRNYKNVALFLEITTSAVSYRIRKKDGIVAENWKLEKITKEDYDFYVSKGIEVIR